MLIKDLHHLPRDRSSLPNPYLNFYQNQLPAHDVALNEADTPPDSDILRPSRHKAGCNLPLSVLRLPPAFLYKNETHLATEDLS